MGIDVHSANFLRYASSRRSIGRVLTIGRQEVHLSEKQLAEIGVAPQHRGQKYCENLLIERFGASEVESLDNSAYEQATLIADLNKPIDQACEAFDTIFDGGALEHVYDIREAFLNVSRLCKPGGQIIHVLPANNFCGHGFWQFSPEVFFSLYSKKNGYSEVEIFLADLTKLDVWYRVKQPTGAKRVSAQSRNPVYVLVRALRSDEKFTHEAIQQSDYVHEWNKDDGASLGSTPRVSAYLSRKPLVSRIRGALLPRKLRRLQEKSLSRWNPLLEKLMISDFVGI